MLCSDGLLLFSPFVLCTLVSGTLVFVNYKVIIVLQERELIFIRKTTKCFFHLNSDKILDQGQ